MESIEIMRVGSDNWEPSSYEKVKQIADMGEGFLKSVRINGNIIINVLTDDIQQDVITEQSENGIVTFTCQLADAPPPKESSRIFPCDRCKQNVWVDPKMYSLWQSSDGQILCIQCSAKVASVNSNE